MKKISQIAIKIIMILLVVQLIYMPVSQASFWGEIFDAGDNFLNEGKNASSNIVADNSVNTEFNRIYNVLFGIGVALTVIIGAILGIKFMIGTVEEQAKVKEMLMPYIIGCVVIFGAFGIWKLAINIFSNI